MSYFCHRLQGFTIRRRYRSPFQPGGITLGFGVQVGMFRTMMLQQGMELRSMVHVFEVTEFMHNHIVLQLRRKLQQTPVQLDLATAGTLPPAATPVADFHGGRLQACYLCQLKGTWLEQTFSLLNKPAFQLIADHVGFGTANTVRQGYLKPC